MGRVAEAIEPTRYERGALRLGYEALISGLAYELAETLHSFDPTEPQAEVAALEAASLLCLAELTQAVGEHHEKFADELNLADEANDERFIAEYSAALVRIFDNAPLSQDELLRLARLPDLDDDFMDETDRGALARWSRWLVTAHEQGEAPAAPRALSAEAREVKFGAIAVFRYMFDDRWSYGTPPNLIPAEWEASPW
jgi:hypothetical protein